MPSFSGSSVYHLPLALSNFTAMERLVEYERLFNAFGENAVANPIDSVATATTTNINAMWFWKKPMAFGFVVRTTIL